MSEELRTINEDEVAAWAHALWRGFLHPLHQEVGDHFRPEWDLGRCWAAFDDGAIVATMRSFPTTFTVPGPADVWASAVTGVTVASTHRRRGILRRMMSTELRASRERGEPLSILIAAEYPIYGRYGFGPATESARYEVATREVHWRHEPSPGTVSFVEPEELRTEAPAVYDRFRAATPGSIQRSDWWWDHVLARGDVPGREPWNGLCLLGRDEHGVADGYARYHFTENWQDMVPQATLHLDELIATRPEAYRRLWQVCAGVDLVRRIDAPDRPVDEALPLLLHDGRAVRQAARFDHVWLRILDLATVLEGRRYGAEGSLVFAVDDPLGYTKGRVLLECGPDGASCAATTRDPDVSLGVDALGALYLGAMSPTTLARAGRVIEHRAGMLERLGVMLRSDLAPWCATDF